MTQRADPRRVGLAAELTPPPRRPCRRQSTATLFERRADLLRGEIGQSAPRFGNQAAPATREPHEATPYTATAARRAVATAAAHAPAPNTIATPSESMNGGSPIAAGSRHARSAASP